jgi:hypothetical protein
MSQPDVLKRSFLTRLQTTLISAVKNPFQNLSSSGTFLVRTNRPAKAWATVRVVANSPAVFWRFPA